MLNPHHQTQSMSIEDDRRHIDRLYQVSSLLRNKRFLAYYNSEQWRFKGDPSLLFVKLRKLFRHQAESSVSLTAKNKLRTAGGSLSTVPELELFTLLARETNQVADVLSEGMRMKKQNHKFRVPKGMQAAQAIHQLANLSSMNETTRWMVTSRHRFGMGTDAYSDTRNLLTELGKFVESMHTLRTSRDNSRYEALLSRAMGKGVDYFLQGYPYDLLAYDACDYHEPGKQVALTLLEEHYCSTYPVMVNESVPQFLEGYQEHVA